MKIVVTISPGNSGGGAVHDFIEMNTEYTSPFSGHEFRLLQDPDGLINLYNNFYPDFTINNCANALQRFKRYTEALSELEMLVNTKNEKIFKGLNTISNEFIKKITLLNYSALPQFSALQLNLYERILLKIREKFLNIRSNNQNIIKMILPKNEKIFHKASRKFLKNLIKFKAPNKSKIILDQAISIWNYNKIFNFFDNLKVIIVTRDPRSVFYSMQSRSSKGYPGQEVKKFVCWYSFIINKFHSNLNKSPKNKNVLKVNFENFVTKKNTKEEILKFIGEKEINYKFNFSESKYNAFKAQTLLSNEDQMYIKNKLKPFLQW